LPENEGHTTNFLPLEEAIFGVCVDGRTMKEFVVFVRHFFSILMMVRHVLAALLALIAMGAGLISIAEGMNYWEALYLTLITGLTVGYGDLAPTTVLGRIVSVLVALIGLVFFGIVVAVANRAIVKTLEEQRSKQKSDNR
jgi:hypothetical protein